MRYQARVGRYLRKLDWEVLEGIWINFEDQLGVGWAQPDFICIQKEKLYVIEVKRTRDPAQADAQLCGLYGPLARAIEAQGGFGERPAPRPCFLLHTFLWPHGDPRPHSLAGPQRPEALQLLPDTVVDWHLRL